MSWRPRLLPIVVVAATALLGFKVAGLIMGDPADIAPDAMAQAATSTPRGQASAAPLDLTKPPGNASANTAPASTPAAAGTAAAPAQKPPTPAPSPAVTTSVKGASAAPSSTKDNVWTKDPQSLSPAEIRVLQQLAQRRVELDRRASDLDQRQVVLEAAEKQIDAKIAKLQALEKSINVDVQKQNAADDTRIQSLVKIYEAMKPQDAAHIFDHLNMSVLLEVIQRMRELKTAPILAAMDPTKAEAVTIAMAERHNATNLTTSPTQTAASTPAQTP